MVSDFTPASPKETRTRIAILDTGVNVSERMSKYLCKDGSVDLTGYGLDDVVGHGTNLVGIIEKYVDPTKNCIQMIKWFHDEENWHQTPEVSRLKILTKAVDIAVLSGAKYINMSYGGTDFLAAEKEAIIRGLHKGVIFFTAAGNESSNLSIACNFFPACYKVHSKLFHVVANWDGDKFAESSNYGGPVNAYENGQSVEGEGVIMSGSSQSTAVALGKEVRLADTTKR